MTNQQSPLINNIKGALKANFVPAICLQCFAIFIAVSYFYWPASAEVFQFFANVKAENGDYYAVLSTAFFGGLVPFIYLYLSGKVTFMPLRQLTFYVVLWASLGWLVNEFYTLQSHLFGNGADWQTIVKKTLFDQFVFSMILTCPLLALAYLWKEQKFNWLKTYALLGELVKVQLPTTVLTNWLIWIPAVCLIYTMPPDLQIPLFNLVLCFFVLILAILNTEQE